MTNTLVCDPGQAPVENLLEEAQRAVMLAGWIRQAAAGDTEAFERLYRATCASMLARVRRFVGDAHAEDVLAETYLQAWRQLGEFDPRRSHPLVWLAVIARSRALDRLRAEKARGALLTIPWDEPGMEQACPARGPAELCEGRQAAVLVQGLMQDLSRQERLVLGLAYFRESTHAEIAASTGLPLGTVKTLLRRSQEKLRLGCRQNGLLPPARDKAGPPPEAVIPS